MCFMKTHIDVPGGNLVTHEGQGLVETKRVANFYISGTIVTKYAAKGAHNPT